MIDVFIDGRAGAEAARKCEARVREARTGVPFEVVARPEARGRDLVVVDGAALVPDGWLDRLAACAAREAGLGTLSAFSNAGVTSGWPRTSGWSALPEGLAAEALDACFAGENAGESVDLPRPEPACVYMPHAALEAAGPYDAADPEAFFDRVAAAGLRHVLCGDLFVFVADGAHLTVPAASPAMQAFAERDPTRPLRRRIDLARLRGSPRPLLLIVTHRWGGGVQRHVDDLVRLAEAECEVLCLRPDGPETVELAWLRQGETFSAWFDRAHWAEGVALLASLGVERLHFHHVHGLPQEVLDLPARLGRPYDVTLHDYFPICPRYHLDPAAHASCADSTEPCRRCLAERPAQWGLTLDQWRARFHAFLAAAARVIVPSHDMAARIARYFPDVALLEWPHPEAPKAPPKLYKIALLGSVSAIKGARLLEACVEDSKARGLPLHFHVIGHVDRPMATLPEAPLTVGGSYDDDTLPTLLAIERPDAILFLSQVPETYSYTLSAALRSGLPIVATRIGAFIERLRNVPGAVLLPVEVEAAEVNDALLARLRPAAARMQAAPAR